MRAVLATPVWFYSFAPVIQNAAIWYWGYWYWIWWPVVIQPFNGFPLVIMGVYFITQVRIKVKVREIMLFIADLLSGGLAKIFDLMFVTVIDFDIETTTTAVSYLITT